MPDFPSIKFDLTSLKSTVTTVLIAPVPPAVSSIVGIELCHPNWLSAFLALPSLGYYTKLVAIALAAYVAGMVIWLATVIPTSAIATISMVWRRTSEDSQNEKAVRIKLSRAYCSRLGIAEMLPKESDDREWSIWFASISTALGEWEILPAQLNFYAAVESAVIVIVVSMLFSPYRIGWLWVPFVLVFLSAIIGILAETQQEVESDTLASQILKHLVNDQEKADAQASKSNEVC